jgi:hypothetical protein
MGFSLVIIESGFGLEPQSIFCKHIDDKTNETLNAKPSIYRKLHIKKILEAKIDGYK